MLFAGVLALLETFCALSAGSVTAVVPSRWVGGVSGEKGETRGEIRVEGAQLGMFNLEKLWEELIVAFLY